MDIKSITDKLLRTVSDFTGEFNGAYNIRENGGCAARQSTENIKIESREDGKGINITVKPYTKGENVYIPACVNKGGINDVAYNDFYIGEGADVTIIAGCGVHTDDNNEAQHDGVHRFILEKGAKVLYKEKHIGTGKGNGKKKINPVTDIELKEGASLEMDTVQIGGVDDSNRKTTAKLGADARLIVRERLMTDGIEKAISDFDIIMDGDDSGVELISRSVAKGNSYQEFKSCIHGNARCSGHSECDAFLADNGTVNAIPALEASNIDAELIHEAAIGKIAGEQILKLRTLGLTEEEAQERIIAGFLK